MLHPHPSPLSTLSSSGADTDRSLVSGATPCKRCSNAVCCNNGLEQWQWGKEVVVSDVEHLLRHCVKHQGSDNNDGRGIVDLCPMCICGKCYQG